MKLKVVLHPERRRFLRGSDGPAGLFLRGRHPIGGSELYVRLNAEGSASRGPLWRFHAHAPMPCESRHPVPG
jgi:hypothetical protein